MADFLPAFERMMRDEGGYQLTNIQHDRGGQTYAGISRKANPKWEGWVAIDRGDTPASTLVRDYYRANYWEPLRADEISSDVVAETVFNFGVNAGPKQAAKLAQLVVGATPDGVIGPVTLAALNRINPTSFNLAYALAKLKRYAEICKRDPTQKKFLLGWLNRTLERV